MNPFLSMHEIVLPTMSLINLYGKNSGSSSIWLKIISN